MTELAELVERLDREADAVRGKSAHYSEQGDLKEAAAMLQVEYGLRLVAHVIAAVLDDEEG